MTNASVTTEERNLGARWLLVMCCVTGVIVSWLKGTVKVCVCHTTLISTWNCISQCTSLFHQYLTLYISLHIYRCTYDICHCISHSQQCLFLHTSLHIYLCTCDICHCISHSQQYLFLYILLFYMI